MKFNFSCQGSHVADDHGFTLISTLIAVLITGILALAIASLSSNAAKSVQWLNTKMEIAAFHGFLIKSLSSGKICECNLGSQNVRLNTELRMSDIPLGTLRSGCGDQAPVLAAEGQQLPSSTSTLLVKEVKAANIRPTLANQFEFQGEVVVAFYPIVGHPGFQPVRVPIRFTVNPSDPPNRARIASCFDASGSAGLDCVAGRFRPNGTKTLVFTGAREPLPSFDQVFTVKNSDPQSWGLKCNSPWLITSCSYSNDADSNHTGGKDLDYDVRITTEGFCASDDEEFHLRDSELYAICCH